MMRPCCCWQKFLRRWKSSSSAISLQTCSMTMTRLNCSDKTWKVSFTTMQDCKGYFSQERCFQAMFLCSYFEGKAGSSRNKELKNANHGNTIRDVLFRRQGSVFKEQEFKNANHGNSIRAVSLTDHYCLSWETGANIGWTSVANPFRLSQGPSN